MNSVKRSLKEILEEKKQAALAKIKENNERIESQQDRIEIPLVVNDRAAIVEAPLNPTTIIKGEAPVHETPNPSNPATPPHKPTLQELILAKRNQIPSTAAIPTAPITPYRRGRTEGRILRSIQPFH